MRVVRTKLLVNAVGISARGQPSQRSGRRTDGDEDGERDDVDRGPPNELRVSDASLGHAPASRTAVRGSKAQSRIPAVVRYCSKIRCTYQHEHGQRKGRGDDADAELLGDEKCRGADDRRACTCVRGSRAHVGRTHIHGGCQNALRNEPRQGQSRQTIIAVTNAFLPKDQC